MDSLGKGPTTVLDPTYGALLVGVVIAGLFQGMLMVQAYNYFENFPKDRMKNKIVVALVLILDTAHLVLICMAAYSSLVTNWGFIPSLGFAPLTLNMHVIFTALSCLVAQLFFLERIWVFSRRNKWITGLLIILAIAPVVVEIHITSLIVVDTSYTEYDAHSHETMSLFVLTAIADIAIATVTCYYLQREKTSFESTRSVVSKALHIIVATGLATSLIAIGSLILYIAIKDTFYFVALHFQLGRTYTNALLLTLNTRRQMRQMLGDTYRSNRSNQMELGFVSTGPGVTTQNVDNIVCVVQQHTTTDQVGDLRSRGTELGLRDSKSTAYEVDEKRMSVTFEAR
ncbi:hypothetical protein CVT24_004479 [Panaeolus cyanescens]|uniref:DUF6534 domain-containing protein n=1 Tax=Panaeolus cyanescens TaxID=181874 RepID=A0A409YBL7_9AGAR|nr:hypothetical protein CVT24_004479 [Panaeolus cyanescens]